MRRAARIAERAWDEGVAAGLDAGLKIAELRSGALDLSQVPPPPQNPYREPPRANLRWWEALLLAVFQAPVRFRRQDRRV